MPSNPRPTHALTGTGVGISSAGIKPISIDATARMIRGRRGIPNLRVASARATTVPKAIRATGLTKQYLSQLDNGHVRSVQRFPAGRNWASNQRWEIAKLNRSTGAGRKPYGYWIRNAKQIKSHHVRTLAAGCGRAAARGAIIGVIIEAPFAAMEEFVAYRRGQKARLRAIKDGGLKIGIASIGGGIGGTLAFGVCVAGGSVALAKASPVLGAFAAVHYGRRLLKLRRKQGPGPEGIDNSTE